MTHGSHYLGKLYNDLIINSPQTISMDIPSDMGRGRIAQTKIKHGVILSDWQMCYQSDMNVQGPVSKDYMQIIFCLNDGISWGIMDDRWLRNPLEVQDYYNCQEDADEFEQQLKEVLDQNGQRLLLGYIDSANLQRFFERQMLFCQGLSMGLELGLWAQL